MEKVLRRYMVSKESDVYAVSLVTDPAIEENFIFLSKEEQQRIYLESNEKRLVVGPVLIPEKPIYRNDGTNGFYIQFSKEAIEHLAYNYLMSGRMWSTTLQHEEVAENVCIVESWIKTSENDKSVDMGINVPIGSWLCAMKVYDDSTWERIRSGELKGFSVEALVDLDEIILSKINNEMTKENLEQVEVNDTFWNKLKSIIADALGKTEEAPVEAPIEEVAMEAETPEEVIETPTEETPTEESVELAEETPEEAPEEETPAEEDELAKLREENAALKAEIEVLKSQLEEKEAAEAELSKQVEKLSKMPSAEPIKVEASKQSEHPSFLDFASGKIKF